MEQELDVALLAGDRRRGRAHARQSYLSARGASPRRATRACTAGSRMTPLRTSSRPASNCGFTSATTSAPRRSSGGTTGRIWRSEMNDTSMMTMSTGPGRSRERQAAGVEVLDDDDARVVAQRPVELAVADVERDDARRAALQQHVGEAAGRGADVERLAAARRRCRRCRARAPASGRRGRRTG